MSENSYYEDDDEEDIEIFEEDEDEEEWRRREFADPYGKSALRAATETNPRNLPCPTCGRENMLTPKDKSLGYQCDHCADALERGLDF